MNVFVYRTSGWKKDGVVKEYNSLDDCCKTLLATEDFLGASHELIISISDKPDEYQYMVEIYDAYRE